MVTVTKNVWSSDRDIGNLSQEEIDQRVQNLRDDQSGYESSPKRGKILRPVHHPQPVEDLQVHIQVLKEALKKGHCNRSDVYCKLGSVYEKCGNVGEAIHWLRKAVVEYRRNDALETLVDLCHRHGRPVPVPPGVELPKPGTTNLPQDTPQLGSISKLAITPVNSRLAHEKANDNSLWAVLCYSKKSKPGLWANLVRGFSAQEILALFKSDGDCLNLHYESHKLLNKLTHPLEKPEAKICCFELAKRLGVKCRVTVDDYQMALAVVTKYRS